MSKVQRRGGGPADPLDSVHSAELSGIDGHVDDGERKQVFDERSQQLAPDDGGGQELTQSLSVLQVAVHAAEPSSPPLPPEELPPELEPVVASSPCGCAPPSPNAE